MEKVEDIPVWIAGGRVIAILFPVSNGSGETIFEGIGTADIFLSTGNWHPNLDQLTIKTPTWLSTFISSPRRAKFLGFPIRLHPFHSPSCLDDNL